jgi:hypothetical protein
MEARLSDRRRTVLAWSQLLSLNGIGCAVFSEKTLRYSVLFFTGVATALTTCAAALPEDSHAKLPVTIAAAASGGAATILAAIQSQLKTQLDAEYKAAQNELTATKGDLAHEASQADTLAATVVELKTTLETIKALADRNHRDEDGGVRSQGGGSREGSAERGSEEGGAGSHKDRTSPQPTPTAATSGVPPRPPAAPAAKSVIDRRSPPRLASPSVAAAPSIPHPSVPSPPSVVERATDRNSFQQVAADIANRALVKTRGIRRVHVTARPK